MLIAMSNLAKFNKRVKYGENFLLLVCIDCTLEQYTQSSK
jgi:hypothetical protein